MTMIRIFKKIINLKNLKKILIFKHFILKFLNRLIFKILKVNLKKENLDEKNEIFVKIIF